MERLQAADELKVKSHSHGAVAALFALAQELDVAAVIDKHLETTGRRLRPAKAPKAPQPQRPQKNDGLTVGQSLTLAAMGRACHATSKRGFAGWARTTTVAELASVKDVRRLTSQHFWDQMDQVPVEAIAAIEKEIVDRAIKLFKLPLDTVLFDATNFFTFISSDNERAQLPARGKQKQKRNDLRQVSVAMLCSRQHGVPLWHSTYGGNVADAVCFREVLPVLEERMLDLREHGADIESVTVVYDKGNVSRENQRQVDKCKLHYVSALTVASQRNLVDEANPKLDSVELGPGQAVPAYRLKREIWGAERTVVVLCSERLRKGQMTGAMQHVTKAMQWLSELAATPERGKQRRTRGRIERDIENYLKGRQHLTKLIRFQLSGEDPHLALTYSFNQHAFDTLANTTFGRVVLMTDRHNWSTADIIRAYHGQAAVEAVFAHLKDPVHLALRPQFHWTDQKLHIHVFTCVLGYLLAQLLHIRARSAGSTYASMEALLEALERVRKVTVLRRAPGATGPPRVTRQLEDVEPDLAELLPALKIAS